MIALYTNLTHINRWQSFFLSLLSSTLSAVPFLTLEGEAPRMPVNRAANSANVHLLVWLHLAPTQLTMSYERLVFVDLLWRQFRKVNYLAFVNDEADLLPAARASRVMSPPCDQAGHAKTMPAFQRSKLLLSCGQANSAFFCGALSHLNDLLHSPCDSRVDQRLSPLGRCTDLLILADLSGALLRTATRLPQGCKGSFLIVQVGIHWQGSRKEQSNQL